MNRQNTIQRNWLYEQIWQKPATKIANELGITSTALKKICTQMDIPTPKAGHWTKVETGKTVVTPPLPVPGKDTKTTWTIGTTNSSAQKAASQRDKAAREVVEDLPDIKPSTDLDNLHPLVKSTRTQLREDKKNISWENRKNRRRLNCHVSETMIDRACLILDTIVRAVEAQGHEFRCELDEHKGSKRQSRYQNPYDRNEPSGVCWIQVGEQRVHLLLRERNKRVTLPEDKQRWYRNYDEVPSGLLECRLDELYNYKGRISWNDGKIQRIEKLIPLIVAEIPKVGAAKQARHDAQKRREKLWEHERQVRQFHERRTYLNQEAFKGLMEEAVNFRSAQIAREYVEALKVRYGIPSEPDPKSDSLTWLQWIDERIANLDPTSAPTPPWERQAFLDVLENAEEKPPERPGGV